MIATTALALAAYNLAKPFLEKAGEGIARKVGEDIWSLIKKPFQTEQQADVEELALKEPDVFKAQLEQKITEDEVFYKALATLVHKSEQELSGNFQQNINNQGEIGKQVNIQTNSGDLHF